MTTIQAAVYRRLRTGRVAKTVGTRIFADDFARSGTATPFIVFEIDSMESDADLSGTTDWASAELTVVCFDDDSHDVQLLARAVRGDLQDWRDEGSLPVIEWCMYRDTINGVAEPTRSKKLRYRVEVNFQVRFRDLTLAEL